jgi:hypothetical protein
VKQRDQFALAWLERLVAQNAMKTYLMIPADMRERDIAVDEVVDARRPANLVEMSRIIPAAVIDDTPSTNGKGRFAGQKRRLTLNVRRVLIAGIEIAHEMLAIALGVPAEIEQSEDFQGPARLYVRKVAGPLERDPNPCMNQPGQSFDHVPAPRGHVAAEFANFTECSENGADIRQRERLWATHANTPD